MCRQPSTFHHHRHFLHNTNPLFLAWQLLFPTGVNSSVFEKQIINGATIWARLAKLGADHLTRKTAKSPAFNFSLFENLKGFLFITSFSGNGPIWSKRPSFESNEVVKWKSVEDELHSIEKPLNQSDQDNILWKKVPFPYKKLTTKYHFETISFVGAEKHKDTYMAKYQGKI